MSLMRLFKSLYSCHLTYNGSLLILSEIRLLVVLFNNFKFLIKVLDEDWSDSERVSSTQLEVDLKGVEKL